jgi:hypothetical protein
VIIPSVFNYATGEAIELGRALRLPNAALRRKLELEQPEGCAWHGCDRPVAWTEAHHIQHWADGGPTTAENLILLCRFHHGRIHTPGWSVEKTGPGQAIITHHDGHEGLGGNDSAGCGCSDWRTDQDIDTEHQGSDWDVFPTGLYRSEWSEAMKADLDEIAEAIDRDRAIKAMRAAKAKCRAKFATPPPPPPVPVLGCPRQVDCWGEAPHYQAAQPDTRKGSGPPACPKQETDPIQHPPIAARPNPGPTRPGSRRATGTQPLPRCRCPIEPEVKRAGMPESDPRPATTLSSPPDRTRTQPDRAAGERPEPRCHLVVAAWLTFDWRGQGHEDGPKPLSALRGKGRTTSRPHRPLNNRIDRTLVMLR